MPALVMMVTGRYCGRIFIFAPLPHPHPLTPTLTTHFVVSRRNVKNHTMGGPIKNCSIQCFDLYLPPPPTLQYNFLISSFLYTVLYRVSCLQPIRPSYSFFFTGFNILYKIWVNPKRFILYITARTVVPENLNYFVNLNGKAPYTLQILNTFFMWSFI